MTLPTGRHGIAGAATAMALLSALTAPAEGQEPQGAFAGRPPLCLADDPRVEVLLLGSYHMANPGQDAFNLKADDVTTPERQAEVEALVRRLATFRPTRVAVEAPYADSVTWRSAYAAYRSGGRALAPNEREQIGFRLAAALAHDQIYPVDVRMPLNMAAVGTVAQRNPAHAKRMAEMQSFGQEAMRMMAGWLAGGSVSDMLYRMNQPSVLELAHSPYARFFLPVAEGEQYAGADMVATWYQRNLRILANLHRAIQAREDRVFVVFGQGHIPLLRQFVIDSPDLCLVDPLPFLVDER